AATDARIRRARQLMAEIDRIVASTPEGEARRQALRALKAEVDQANLSTVCDKRELEIPVHGPRINLLQAAATVIADWWQSRIASRQLPLRHPPE
ncbi:hypothetical protein, partial [Thermanaerothrix sp.]|uniref:hypothetical protein n=1 Tax=Thermanaerothrix sp. TaxID=2972675 RepID=UPI002ADD754B